MCPACGAVWTAVPFPRHETVAGTQWDVPIAVDGAVDPCARSARRGRRSDGLPPRPPRPAPPVPRDAQSSTSSTVSSMDVLHNLLIGVKSAFGGGKAPPSRLLARYAAQSAASLSDDELETLAAAACVDTDDRLAESPPGSPAGPCYLPPARAPPSVLDAARRSGCGRLAVAVGAHYFCRAAAACPRLAAAAATHPATAAFLPPGAALAAARASSAVRCVRPGGRGVGAALAARRALAPGAWPAGVLAACVWLGAKVVGDRRRAGGLAAMVVALCGRGARREDAAAAEADVLAALDWRLGPFFVVRGDE